MKPVKIGLFGYGTVGEAFCQALSSFPELSVSVEKICIRHPEKSRSNSPYYFTSQASELLHDPAIDLIVELIDDAEAAYHIVKEALQKKLPVISANKKMIAAHLLELIALQRQYQVPLLYEASCGAGLPIIRLLEQYYSHELPVTLRGIINGSTNYILSQMHVQQLSYSDALLQAVQHGFAETNPANDTEGHDAVSKWRILLAHGLGITETNTPILFSGITHVSPLDIQVAQSRGACIKLVANIYKTDSSQYAAFVLPQWVAKKDNLYDVANEYNGVEWQSSQAGTHFFKGKGAGGEATAAAVLADVAAWQQQYLYPYTKQQAPLLPQLQHNYYLNVYVSADGCPLPAAACFEWIEEQHISRKHSWLTGVVHVSELLQNNW
jgi:homoserine dehydrogenase